MTFAIPAALWLLIPLAVLLADRFRRRDRRRVLVATMSIWRALAASEGRLTRRRRLPLELLIEAILGLLLVLIAAGPGLEIEAPNEIVVLVDSGSAMQTPERRAAVKAAIEKLEKDSGRAVLVQRIPPAEDGELVVTDSLPWADRLADFAAGGREVYLIADAVADLERLPVGAGLVVVADPFINLGVTALDCRIVGDEAQIFVAVAASLAACPNRAHIKLQLESGLLLAEETLDLTAARAESSVEFRIAGGLPRGKIEVVLDQAPGPSFDDRVEILVGEAPSRPVILPFAGAESWGAALEACGRHPIKSGSVRLGADTELIIGPESALEEGGRALVPAADGVSTRSGVATDPALIGAPLEAPAGGLLDGLPGLDRLPGASGRYFGPLPEGVQVLARRSGRPVIVLDARDGRLLLADPESAADWRDLPSFPLLVARLAEALSGLGGQARVEVGPLSSAGESQGLAADPASSRPASTVAPRRKSRPLVDLGASLALLSCGILAFLRRPGRGRRESTHGD